MNDTPSPIRVLFVCHGNICRSTMAEFVLKDMVAKRGLTDRFHIASAATSTEELGNPVYPGTVQVLQEHGISGFEDKRARQLCAADYDHFDLLIGMDSANTKNMHRMLKGDPRSKIHKMMRFAGSDRDVADPWYTGDFDTTYEDVCDGCTGLLGFLGL